MFQAALDSKYIRQKFASKEFNADWLVYVLIALKISNTTFCMSEFCMIFSMGSYYFLKEHLISVVLKFFCGME
jgi:hypothetical protein